MLCQVRQKEHFKIQMVSGGEHYEIALMLYVKCVEMLREIAPVDVLHSMSNHDYQSGFHLAHTLKSWFRKAEDVKFDVSVSARKYYQYGKNLI